MCQIDEYANEMAIPMFQLYSRLLIVSLAVLIQWISTMVRADTSDHTVTLRVRLSITTPLSYSNTPLDPVIDFPCLIQEAQTAGVLDPNSIVVINVATDEPIHRAITEDFAYSDRGRLEFVVADPRHTEFEIRFNVVKKRPPLRPQIVTPQIGVGDLLRYNSGDPGPVTLFHSMGLHDLTGDGRPDLVGSWNYFYRPGTPTGGIVFYPSTEIENPFRFGDLQRLRYRPQSSSDRTSGGSDPVDFSHHYNAADFADFNGDGKPDFVYTRSGANTAEFYFGTDERTPGGAPVFVPRGTVPVSGFFPCRAVDMNGDGVLDLVVNGQYIQNMGTGWPFQPSAPVDVDAGVGACFSDLDGDGFVDSVCLAEQTVSNGTRLVWRRHLGGDSPAFASPQPVAGVPLSNCTMVAAANVGDVQFLFIQTDFQQIHVYEQTGFQPPRFRRRDRAESFSAVLSLSDQAWPCLCDWDNDGDLDLLIGDGYGWPRLVRNDGNCRCPIFAEPQRVVANGEPIRVLRNEILGSPDNWHNMGYLYPDFVDWDADGLRDLMLPNETNRIYWYRNIGSRKQPRFGPRQQILCDGYPDSPEMRSQSQARANDPNSNNGVYPLEEERPFFWRTGVAFADFNGDGLPDLATMDGFRRQATLFTQYKVESDASTKPQQLRLRRDRPLRLIDGRPVDDRIVRRGCHWGESLRAFD